MTSDEDIVRAIASVPEQSPAFEGGPSTNTDESNKIPPQETEKITEGQRTTPDFPWQWPGDMYLHREFAEAYTLEEKEKAFKSTAGVVKKYSDEMVKRWNVEIDNLLVYAGLFSAVLTAFNVQSYILLQPATPDPTLLMLQQISQQLNSFSVTPTGTLVNSTHPVSFTPVQAPPVERWAVWLNSLWFSSLIFSLASASTGIMVKQWIHEYQAGISSDSPEIARLRQYRLNRLEKWHVAEIVAFLPVLLQIALFLFFSGLLVLLWNYHSTVAIVASVLIGLVALFVVGTTIMPLIWSDCCYLSPPLYSLFIFVQHCRYGFFWLFGPVCKKIYDLCSSFQTGGLPKGLKSWASKQDWAPRKITTWRGREQSTVQLTSFTLDVDMTVHAYSTTIDIRHLTEAGAILASHGVREIHRQYTEVQKINEQHFGEKDIRVPSAEFGASQLFYSIRQGDNVYDLLSSFQSYRDNLSPSMYHRILLALAVTVSKSDVSSRMHWQSLRLLEKLFTFNSDALKLMPWIAVCHVASAMGEQLPRDRVVQEDQWKCIFMALRILVRCLLTPVSSWQRSPEDVRAWMQCILSMGFLQKELLQQIVSKTRKKKEIPTILRTLTLILTHLSKSVDAWGCRSAAEDFFEAAGNVAALVESKRPYSVRTEVEETLEELTYILERYRTLDHGNQGASNPQPVVHHKGPIISRPDQTSTTNGPSSSPGDASLSL